MYRGINHYKISNFKLLLQFSLQQGIVLACLKITRISTTSARRTTTVHAALPISSADPTSPFRAPIAGPTSASAPWAPPGTNQNSPASTSQRSKVARTWRQHVDSSCTGSCPKRVFRKPRHPTRNRPPGEPNPLLPVRLRDPLRGTQPGYGIHQLQDPNRCPSRKDHIRCLKDHFRRQKKHFRCQNTSTRQQETLAISDQGQPLFSTMISEVYRY